MPEKDLERLRIRQHEYRQTPEIKNSGGNTWSRIVKLLYIKDLNLVHTNSNNNNYSIKIQ